MYDPDAAVHRVLISPESLRVIERALEHTESDYSDDLSFRRDVVGVLEMVRSWRQQEGRV